MTNESAYQLVKRYINQQFEEHKRFVDQHNRLAAKAERDRILSILATLRTEEPA